jgi:glutamyl-Q tRNA(Asp) synthetase
LLTAFAGFLQARSAGGQWLLRIDDLDTERSRAKATEQILRQLEAHGLHWDETPRLQSQHIEEYETAFAGLRQRGLLFPCVCSRARLARDSLPGIDGAVYAGTCRGGVSTPEHVAWRLRVSDGTLQLDDAWQGRLQRDLARDMGDFAVRRADGQIGYQLACVVDEAAQGIGEVVRGADLIGSSLRQVYLQSLLGLPSPAYRHLPLLLDGNGRKLSKQNHAQPIDAAHAVANLYRCLQLLGQAPPFQLRGESVEKVVRWAQSHWDAAKVPRGLQHPQPPA